jgi:hypothetical protein
MFPSDQHNLKKGDAIMTIKILRQRTILALCVFVVLLIAIQPNNASAQTPAFTYQGKLADNGTPANGLYDFIVSLWDAGTNGNQIGSTLNLVNRQVTDGIFTLTLNFGAGVFNGQSRFLEISVKPSGSANPPTVLSPRQFVVSTPYAIKSLGSASADSLSLACVNCITSSQILSVNGSSIVGPIPLGSLPQGNNNYIQNTTIEQPSSAFNVSGVGRANIFDAALQFSILGNRILSNLGVNNLFAGNGSGQNNTTGDNESFFGWQSGVSNTTGTGNSFFGSLAGQLNNTGNDNSFFGRGAGFSNTVGSSNSYFGANAGRFGSGNNNSFFGVTAGFGSLGNDNSFFGASAGKLSTNSSNNSFFGSSAGLNNAASNNSFFGKNAGIANTTGANNAFLGSDAGAANTIGGNNSFFGSSSGTNNTGSNNSFFGSSSGANNTAGNNSFFGKSAGFANTTGASNSFVGADAGTANTTGSNNSLFGKSAGITNTTGSLNAFFGTEAGSSNVTGGGNSFFGYRAGFANTSNSNSFFGKSAGSNNSTGFNNSFFGWETGFNNNGNNNAFFGVSAGFANTGNENSFFGAGAGPSNTTGFLNTFIGRSAGAANTTGHSNTFIGSQTGSSNNTGIDNVFVGNGAGELNTNGGGNVFIGIDAGKTNLTGANNTIIGANADVDPSNPNLQNATAIGTRAVVGQSNSIVLGAIKDVNGSAADTFVGIGTIAPAYPLTIRSSFNFPGGVFGWSHTNGDIVLVSKVGGTGGDPYGGWIGTVSNHPLNFFVTNSKTPSLFIEKNGFVGVNGIDVDGSTNVCFGFLNHLSYCSSSLRYKTDVQSFTGGLDILNRLRPITFTWKKSGKRDIGFGAEEVEKVEPLLTFRNPEGEVEGVKYSQISAVLVNAIKEQQTQITFLRKKIEDLESIKTENAQLKGQLAELMARLGRIEQGLSAEGMR